jgi:hypothetical protein
MKTRKNILILLLAAIVIFNGSCSSRTDTAENREESAVTAEVSVSETNGLGSEVFDEIKDKYLMLPEDEPVEEIITGTGDIEITGSGVYRISGVLQDGQIIVDSDDDEPVWIILNGAEITDSDSAAIYVKSADKTIIYLEEGTVNSVSDGEEYYYDDPENDEPKAAVFSKDDLIITGPGTLIVEGNFNDGISGKDDLYINGATIRIEAEDDGIVGKDSLIIENSIISITSEGDGLKSSNDEEGKGYIAIADSALDITSGDDGIHGEQNLLIDGGTITIHESYEGLESGIIRIVSGDIEIHSSDDGINAAGEGNGNYQLIIEGGNIYVDADGDGLDANGTITMTGGNVIVDGPEGQMNGSLDYDVDFIITGGQLIASGSAGMAMAPGTASSQGSILVRFNSTGAAGTEVTLLDGNGSIIASAKPEKSFQTIVFSSPEIKADSEYSLEVNGNGIIDFTTVSLVSQVSEDGQVSEYQGGHGGPGQPGMGPQRGGDFRQPPEGAPDGPMGDFQRQPPEQR